jgi:hypothetical protein
MRKKNMSRAIVQAKEKESCIDHNGTSIVLSKRQSLASFPRIQMTNIVSNLNFFYTEETNEELASTVNGTAIHLKSYSSSLVHLLCDRKRQKNPSAKDYYSTYSLIQGQLQGNKEKGGK